MKIEAKKHSFRQTQDGVVISFVLHPSDVSPELAIAPLGTPYEIELRELDYDNPEQKPERTEGEKAVQRAVMLCKDPEFQHWANETHQDESVARKYLLYRCGVESRSALATNADALSKFLIMETEFKQSTGRMARPRG